MVRTIRILQADTDCAFRHRVAQYFDLLEDVEYLCGVEGGQDIIAAIQEHKPNVVLLDIHLPPGGGFPVLEEIRTRWAKSLLTVILFATADQEGALAEAARLGADYVILRPVELVVLENRIRQLLVGEGASVQTSLTLKQVQDVCKHYFEQMGVPPHYKGYRYLVEGIWLAISHPDWLNAMTRKLYPAIGQRFATSASQVERAMRYALDITWEKGNLDELYRLFPYEILASKGKPTNSAFIAKMVDLVNLELGFPG